MLLSESVLFELEPVLVAITVDDDAIVDEQVIRIREELGMDREVELPLRFYVVQGLGLLVGEVGRNRLHLVPVLLDRFG